MDAHAAGDSAPNRPYRHGDLPNAMRSAARAILDEGGPESVGLRETARRVGVSATAAYRHFASKEDLLASVAAGGFDELREAIEQAEGAGPPLVARGMVYIDFAARRRGLFRLMFGPVLVERAKYPALDEAARSVFALLQGRNGAPRDGAPGVGGWALVHGLACLVMDGLMPQPQARQMAESALELAANSLAN